MRTLMKVTMPVEQSSRAIKDGSLPKTMQALISELRPECSYFFTENGRRTALFVFDLKEPAQMPQVAEPLFSQLSAEVQFCPVMNAEELKAGLERAAKHAGRQPVTA